MKKFIQKGYFALFVGRIFMNDVQALVAQIRDCVVTFLARVCHLPSSPLPGYNWPSLGSFLFILY